LSAAASQIYTMADGLPALTGSGLHEIRVALDIALDSFGNVTNGASSTSPAGFTGFLIWEDADDNGSFDDSIDTVILAGDVLALRAENTTDTPDGQIPTVNDIDNYDVLVDVVGGTLAGAFDPIVGMAWSSEASSFDGSFAEDFGGEAKAVIGDVDVDCVCVELRTENQLDEIAISGALTSSRTQSQSIVAILDVSDAAGSPGGAGDFPEAGDPNGSGRTGSPVDAALMGLWELAAQLVIEGRGGQPIAVLTNARASDARVIAGGPAAGEPINTVLTDFGGAPITAQVIVDAAGVDVTVPGFDPTDQTTTDNAAAGLAGSGIFAGVFDFVEDGGFDTISVGEALSRAAAWLAGEGAETNQAIMLTASTGFSAALNAPDPADDPNLIGADVSGGDSLVAGKASVAPFPDHGDADAGALSPGLLSLQPQGVTGGTGIVLADFFDRGVLDVDAYLRGVTGALPGDVITVTEFETTTGLGRININGVPWAETGGLKWNFSGFIAAERGAYGPSTVFTTGTITGGTVLELRTEFGALVGASELDLLGVIAGAFPGFDSYEIRDFDPYTSVG
ncbi:hypothetical protein, partial [Paralimibaculum aggregatum]|uniref:hypothetical protein n=1 Tax=Paralimibaculum aggregatum TaxID=3036245 RepID=UPI002552B3D8